MTTARIDARFAALKAEGRAGFVAYVMAGDPSPEATLDILNGLVDAGADVLELGFPFSDPMAEGPTIQRAALRGLKSGLTLRGTLELARRFREGNAETPLILMGYLNPGVDGVIVVDCPPEESADLVAALDAARLSLIRLATPTSDDDRLKVIARGTSGFVYYVSVAGVTGVKEAVAGDVAPAVARVRSATGLPVAVGFGVKTAERAAEIARVADAVVVGSALVDRIEAAVTENRDPVADVLSLARDLSLAVHNARTAEIV
jgi:tryptophan synthase alpha chain